MSLDLIFYVTLATNRIQKTGIILEFFASIELTDFTMRSTIIFLITKSIFNKIYVHLQILIVSYLWENGGFLQDDWFVFSLDILV